MPSFRDFCSKENYQMMSTNQTTQKLAKKVADVKQKVRKRVRAVDESNDILAESQEMIQALQDKIQQVFYRFGMAGLERLDEAIIDTCQQMLHPEGIPQKVKNRSQSPSTTRETTQPVQTSKPKTRAQTALEIAAAALHQMEPMRPIEEANSPAITNEQVPTPTPVNNQRAFNPITDLPHKQAQSDYMAQFADANLNPEELAILQQGLAQEGL